MEENEAEYAAKIVALHTRNIICAGEVWEQCCLRASDESFPLWAAALTPELRSYFQKRFAYDSRLSRFETFVT
jgi:hypothetical protein